MNVLLVNPPIRESRPAYFQPVGLAVVAAVLQEGGHNVEILDLNIIRPELGAVEALLPAGPFDWVGISGLITTFKYLRFLVPLLREKYGLPIVIGGGGITSAPKTYMETFAPDYGVVGEGEYTALDVCKVIAGEAKAGDVPGIVYFDDGKTVFTAPRPLEKNLDNFPDQAFDLMDIDAYAKNVRHNNLVEREVGILATRGCPWNCAFCYHIFGRGVRYRSPKRVVNEMQFLINKYGIESFLFADECLTAKRAFVHEFCNEILNRGMKPAWMCYTRADALDEETMALMAKAGCYQVGYGIESGSQRILDAMNKNIKLDTVKEAWKMAHRHFRHVGATFIFGMPEESDETIAETVEFLTDLKLVPAHFHLTAYPGTRIFEDNKDKILAQHGTLANFFSSLGDAGMFSTNLTRWTNDEYITKMFNIRRRIKGNLMAGAIAADRINDVMRAAVSMDGDYQYWCNLLYRQPGRCLEV